MRKFENNFTSREQSERLLLLGVPADSADCFYKRHLCKKDEYFEEPKVLPDGLTFSSYCGTETGVDKDIYVPCWSAGRLIEIQEKCTGSRFFRTLHPDLLGDIIGQIEYTVGTVGMNFSKLD